MIDDKVKNSIDENLKDAIDNKLEEKNISNDEIDDFVNKSVNKMVKSNKNLSKLIDDREKNSIIKNLKDVLKNKLEGINIYDEKMDENVNKKKERKIDQKLKDDVKFIFDDFM